MLRISSQMRYSFLSLAALATLAFGLTFTPARVTAQVQIQLSGGISPAGMLRKVAMKQQQDHVTLSPEHSVFDAKAHTATITLINPGPDTLNLTLLCQYTPPAHAGTMASHTTKAMTNASADSSARDMTGMTVKTANTTHESSPSVDTTYSLASWISGLPNTIRLLPHATQQVTLTVSVPPHVKPGTYSGWVVVTATAPPEIGGSGMHISVQPQVSAGRLIYQVR
jgi:hypothetical protein